MGKLIKKLNIIGYYAHNVIRDTKFYLWVAREKVNIFLGLDGYIGYFSEAEKTERKAKKLSKKVDLFGNIH